MRKSWKLLTILLKIKIVLLMTCTLKVRISRKVMAIFVNLNLSQFIISLIKLLNLAASNC